MRRRCENKKAKDYKNYGGRGIVVCARWSSFENFIADMGAAPEGMSLERNDVNGNYEPSNCCWASIDVQSNNKRTTVYVDVDGVRMSAKQASVLLCAPYERVLWAVHRYGDGWLGFVRAAAAIGRQMGAGNG